MSFSAKLHAELKDAPTQRPSPKALNIEAADRVSAARIMVNGRPAVFRDSMDIVVAALVCLSRDTTRDLPISAETYSALVTLRTCISRDITASSDVANREAASNQRRLVNTVYGNF